VGGLAVGGRDADTIRHLVEYSTQVGVLQPTLQSQISDVIELEGLTVEAITKPNTAPTSVAPDAVVADVRAAVLASGHLRILLRDDTGRFPRVVHVRETLQARDDQRAHDWSRRDLRHWAS
jgi:CBS domain containing-hemolysin-like protein